MLRYRTKPQAPDTRARRPPIPHRRDRRTMSRRLTACVASVAAALTPVAAVAFLFRHPGAIAFGVIGAVLTIFAGWCALTRRASTVNR
jgi:hypothetical protein